MRYIKNFSVFESNKIYANILKKIISNYAKDKPLDVEDESSLLAICKKLGIEPTDVYKNKMVPKFKGVSESKESGLSRRTKNFLNKIICDYLNVDEFVKDKDKIEELLSKLGLNFNEVVDKCYT
jgi:hypothetical protein